MVKNVIDWLFNVNVYQNSWFGQHVLATETGIGAVFLITLVVAAGVIVFNKKLRNIFF